mmetsp:Transcript_22472/g.59387  ORF Transcript_22472/g.59387 Transcript_22472/m.59387 type:complete len:215 (-) Transcript_22472:397-1041(-)
MQEKASSFVVPSTVWTHRTCWWPQLPSGPTTSSPRANCTRRLVVTAAIAGVPTKVGRDITTWGTPATRDRGITHRWLWSWEPPCPICSQITTTYRIRLGTTACSTPPTRTLWTAAASTPRRTVASTVLEDGWTTTPAPLPRMRRRRERGTTQRGARGKIPIGEVEQGVTSKHHSSKSTRRTLSTATATTSWMTPRVTATRPSRATVGMIGCRIG